MKNLALKFLRSELFLRTLFIEIASKRPTSAETFNFKYVDSLIEFFVQTF